MADEPREVTRVEWMDVFSFTRVFKSFRLALNLSNMTLALAALFLVCLTGWVMDEIWSVAGRSVMVSSSGENEIAVYSRTSGSAFPAVRSTWEQNRPEAAKELRIKADRERRNFSEFLKLLQSKAGGRRFFVAFGNGVEALKADDDARAKESGGKAYAAPDPQKVLEKAEAEWQTVLDEARQDHQHFVEQTESLIETTNKKVEEGIDKGTSLASDDDKKKAAKRLKADRLIALRTLTKVKTNFNENVDRVRGVKIADSLIAYESVCMKDAVSALLTGNIAAGLAEYGEPGRPRGAGGGQPGFLVQLMKARDGVCWLLSRHYVYAGIFCLIVLVIWSIFGGAIHRIAAVQAAREEKISLVQALRFSRGRFLGFFLAPLFPLALIGILGCVLMLGGLLGNIPIAGPFLVGLLFFFAILLGLIIAFLAIGLLGGGALMFPTVAVEGSDSFDAISRSFAYVWSRPWRAALYGAVAVVHGSICYLFVRFFAFLALSATHLFVRGAIWKTAESVPNVPDADTMDAMWAKPTFASLHEWNWEAMSGPESVGAVLLAIWVYLVIGGVLAFVLSYFAGSTTTIYYLLRREVDATDLDEVYVDDEDEEPPFEAPGQAEETAEEADEAPASAEPESDEAADEEESPSDDQTPEGDDEEKEDKKS